MSFFISNETYKRTITDPVSGEEAEVELRPLNAGDRAALEDTIRMEAGDSNPQVLLGTMRRLTVERALVGWSLEVSPTPETIKSLNPDVFEQIFEHVNMGGVTEDPKDVKKSLKAK